MASQVAFCLRTVAVCIKSGGLAQHSGVTIIREAVDENYWGGLRGRLILLRDSGPTLPMSNRSAARQQRDHGDKQR